MWLASFNQMSLYYLSYMRRIIRFSRSKPKRKRKKKTKEEKRREEERRERERERDGADRRRELIRPLRALTRERERERRERQEKSGHISFLFRFFFCFFSHFHGRFHYSAFLFWKAKQTTYYYKTYSAICRKEEGGREESGSTNAIVGSLTS